MSEFNRSNFVDDANRLHVFICVVKRVWGVTSVECFFACYFEKKINNYIAEETNSK